MQDINSCSINPPRIIAIGGEFQRDTKANSGVLLLNVSALAEHRDGLVAWGVRNSFPSYDQIMILNYFRQEQLDQLPDEMNWKVTGSGTSRPVLASCCRHTL
jgi:hypothetical protein